MALMRLRVYGEKFLRKALCAYGEKILHWQRKSVQSDIQMQISFSPSFRKKNFFAMIFKFNVQLNSHQSSLHGKGLQLL